MRDSLAAVARDVVRCRRCPRLVAWRERVAREKVARFRNEKYWGRPVPGFGDPEARLLLVGLAPAAHGGNRTGRMFTGDGSGDFLIPALFRARFANRPESLRRGDGLRLRGLYMTAICRCAPPGNRPTPREIRNCRPFLLREVAALPRLRAVLALGGVALAGWADAAGVGRPPFRHGGEWAPAGSRLRVFASFHPSRQNTQTGKLNSAMLDSVLRRVRRFLARPRPAPSGTLIGR